MIDLVSVQNRVKGHSLVRSIDMLPKGHVRLETAFLYPDGGSIDVFLVQETPLLNTTKLSDLGQTSSWLLDVQVRPWLSKKRQRFVADALRIYNVTQAAGALERELPSMDDLIEGVIGLGQACVRVADLTYTRRASLQSTVDEEVEEILSDAELDFDSNAELEGRFGAKLRVNFLVRGARATSAVLTLATSNASQAHITANEVFRKWYDLDVPERSEHRVTVFDDRVNVYREEDLRRLRNLSDVVALSDRQTMTDLLAA